MSQDDFKAATEPISKVAYTYKCGLLSDSILDDNIGNIIFYTREFIDILVASVRCTNVTNDIIRIMEDFEEYRIFDTYDHPEKCCLCYNQITI